MKQLLIALTILLVGCNGQQAPQQQPQATVAAQVPVSAEDVIPRAMIFNYNVTDQDSEVGQVDVVTGATYATPQSIKNYAYVSQTVAHAYYGGQSISPSLAWFQANHPDWIEYQCDQKTMATEFGTSYVPLDFANPNVQQWMLHSWVIPAAGEGYVGVYFDNVWMYNGTARCGHYSLSGQWVRQYSGQSIDAQYESDVIAWATEMRQLIHTDLPDFQFGINYSINPDVDFNSQQKLLSLVDMQLDECGFTQCSVGVPDATLFNKTLTSDLSVGNRGACLVDNGEIADTGDASSRLWVIATYLMIESPCSYVAIEGVQQYGVLLDFPEYHLNVGTPLDSATEQADGRWVRHFQNATVTVNPNDGMATINPENN